MNNGEACDDGNTVDDDACSNACVVNYCGDGVVNNGEACDDGANGDIGDGCNDLCEITVNAVCGSSYDSQTLYDFDNNGDIIDGSTL